MLPKALIHAAEQALTEFTGEPVRITGTRALGGGCINPAVALETNSKNYFLKYNSAQKHPGMFEAEVKGLALLRSTGALYIPSVIHCGEASGDAFILMELVEQGRPAATFWTDFGSSLARMHKITRSQFGLDHDNYIGSLQQSNREHSTWAEFFMNERIEPQLRLARDAGKINAPVIAHFDSLFIKLGEIFPAEPPALLHGDLWSGNYMRSPQGKACIYDPAVYFGHREMDIAMTKLFGGFTEDFYTGYNNELPLEKGWKQRIDICNLYSLLVHVNLFGGGYVNDVEAIVRRF